MRTDYYLIDRWVISVEKKKQVIASGSAYFILLVVKWRLFNNKLGKHVQCRKLPFILKFFFSCRQVFWRQKVGFNLYKPSWDKTFCCCFLSFIYTSVLFPFCYSALKGFKQATTYKARRSKKIELFMWQTTSHVFMDTEAFRWLEIVPEARSTDSYLNYVWFIEPQWSFTKE